MVTSDDLFTVLDWLFTSPCQKAKTEVMADSGAMWRPPRTCDDYWSNFRHCKSLWNRFHNYYAHGTSPSCGQWKEDYYSCREWEKNPGPETKDALQQSERNREAEQRKFTPVWDLRRDPPRDWHMPLHQGKPPDSQS